MEIKQAEAAIEAILFAMGDSVELEKIAKAIQQDTETTRKIIGHMMDGYRKKDRGIQIMELDGAYQLCTKQELYPYLIRVARQPKKLALTDVVMETLSIIAYKQPITKLEIEKIRGVKCDHAVNKLVEYNLVKELGRLDAPGRPLLFGTTEEFLRYFGLHSLEDLPSLNPVQIEDFKAEGKTIIFVSHDISSVAKYCDRVILLNKGVKLSEGNPKDTINLYKKVLLNQSQNIASGQVLADAKENGKKKLWKSNYELNPQVNEYGTGEAEIIDFAVIDEYGSYTSCIQKGTSFTIRSKVQFHTDIQDPIFTYTFKTVQGTAVTGTNTMYEKVGVGLARAGEIYVASFKQNMDLQGGEYLLSISCTGYVGGEFRAYHRLYDVVGVTVISDKNTVGFYDMNSETTVERVEE